MALVALVLFMPLAVWGMSKATKTGDRSLCSHRCQFGSLAQRTASKRHQKCGGTCYTASWKGAWKPDEQLGEEFGVRDSEVVADGDLPRDFPRRSAAYGAGIALPMERCGDRTGIKRRARQRSGVRGGDALLRRAWNQRGCDSAEVPAGKLRLLSCAVSGERG